MESVVTNYNTILSVMQQMFGDTMVEEGRAGYQDDRRQFSLPGQAQRGIKGNILFGCVDCTSQPIRM